MGLHDALDEDGGVAGGAGDGAPTSRVGNGSGFATYSVPLFTVRRNAPVNELDASEWGRMRMGYYDGDSWQHNIDDPVKREKLVTDFHNLGEVLLVDPSSTMGIILRKKHIRNQSLSGSMGAG